MPTRKVVYAGSFDPITNGHLWMIEHGADLFDELIVAIGINPDKHYTFTLPERLAMLELTTQNLSRVRIDSFENEYLVNYAATAGAKYILRGIRTEADYIYERAMCNINSDLSPNITTVFLFPPRELSEISSSFVKGLIGPSGWQKAIAKYVPEPVYEALLEKSEPT